MCFDSFIDEQGVIDFCLSQVIEYLQFEEGGTLCHGLL